MCILMCILSVLGPNGCAVAEVSLHPVGQQRRRKGRRRDTRYSFKKALTARSSVHCLLEAALHRPLLTWRHITCDSHKYQTDNLFKKTKQNKKQIKN